MAETMIDEARSVHGEALSVTIDDEPITFEWDPTQIGDGIAKAMAAAVTSGIHAITETGPDGHRLFNRSGKLAAGITVIQKSASSFDIVAPEGYLQDDEVAEKLAALVPAIGDPFVDAGVRQATLESLADMITIAPMKKA